MKSDNDKTTFIDVVDIVSGVILIAVMTAFIMLVAYNVLTGL